MADERTANRAREAHSEALRRLGAHGVAVEEVKRGRGRSADYVVVAYFDHEPTPPPPPTLEVSARGRVQKVPLVIRVRERFRPE